jgi:FG-GAP-like repeat
MKKIIACLMLPLLIISCGGGGGGSAAPVTNSTPTSSAQSNTNLVSINPTPVIQNVIDYPTSGNYDYSTFQVKFGHLGSSAANCFVVQTVTRGDRIQNPPNGSSPNIPDAPFYVVCQQSDGTYREVSTQLFGQQYNVNGAYPLIADFNADGIDDIFLIESWDGPATTPYAYTFMSNGQNSYTVTRISTVSPNIALGGGTVAVDINQDGCMDVVSTAAWVMQGDCHGNFVNATIQGSQAVQNNSRNFLYGTSVCLGDFNNTGHPQLLVTDAWVANYSPANNIVEVDGSLTVRGVHPLPAPFFTNRDNQPNGSHNFQCAVGDINNDGKLDIMIFTSNYYEATQGATPQFYVQTYINQGNWIFQDTSATAIAGNINLNLGDSYSPRLIDLNGDGYLDLAFDSPTWSSNSNNLGNQVFVNNKDGTFHSVFTNELKAVADAYRVQLGAAAGQPYLSMLPILNGTSWSYMLGTNDANGHLHIGVANTQYVFK